MWMSSEGKRLRDSPVMVTCAIDRLESMTIPVEDLLSSILMKVLPKHY